jgi:macrolide-specific efflux system membrane fusion protein
MFHYKDITSKGDGAVSAKSTVAGATAKPVPPRSRRRGGIWRWAALIVVVVAAAGAGWWYFVKPPVVVAPQTVAVSRGDVEQTVLASGILQANSLVSVGAQVSGRIEKLDVKLGDVVKSGDPLAEIDSLDQENAVKSSEAALASVTAQLHSAEAAVKTAQAALDRSDQLTAKGLVATADHETAQAAVGTAEAQVEVMTAQLQQATIAVDNAKLNLSRTKITAPSAGTVVAVLVDAGQSVNAVQSSPTIVKLADLGTMIVKAQISEADVPRVKPGQPVYFTILGEPDKRITATLLSIEPAPDSITTETTVSSTSSTAIYYNGLFSVPNPDGKLRIDMTAQVTIVLAQAKNALLVPSSALTASPSGKGYTVGVYDPATKTVERTKVTVGINNNVTAEIQSGLKEGDLVVTTGSARAAGSSPAGAPPGAGTRSGRNFAPGAGSLLGF